MFKFSIGRKLRIAWLSKNEFINPNNVMIRQECRFSKKKKIKLLLLI